MPSTVDYFLQRVRTLNESEATRFADRFTSGQPEDTAFDNRPFYASATDYFLTLGELEFLQAAQVAYTNSSPAQQQCLVDSLTQALKAQGAKAESLKASSNSGEPNANQFSLIANFARQQYPEAMQAMMREQSWFVKAMGLPILMEILGMVATRMVGGSYFNKMDPDFERRTTNTAVGFGHKPMISTGLKSTDRAAQEAVRHRAYEIWERKGRPQNSDLANWLAAELEIFHGQVSSQFLNAGSN